MSHSNGEVSYLLKKHAHLFSALNKGSEVLDLACGTGRNGLALTGNDMKVTFVDNNESALAEVFTKIKGKNRLRREIIGKNRLRREIIGENRLWREIIGKTRLRRTHFSRRPLRGGAKNVKKYKRRKII